MEEWRSLLYPLGFLSSAAFAARFIVQWLESEKAGRSVISRLFWQISLAGNALLMLHSLIQVQYHICIIQGFNAVIAWRNLNFMQTAKKALPFKGVCLILAASWVFLSAAFVLQDWWLGRAFDWFRVPLAPWQSSPAPNAPLIWHLMGFGAFALFSCRFWLQWWCSEKMHSSYFPTSFWWISLFGALASMVYFIRILDFVNLIGPLFGIVPYMRNLILIRKNRSTPDLGPDRLSIKYETSWLASESK